MIRAALIAGLLGLAPLMAVAQAPDSSARPVPRAGAQSTAETPQAAPAETRQRRGLFQSLRPIFRSRAVEKEARAKQQQLAKGALCGDLAIQGEAVGRVTGRLRGCTVENAVRVQSVSGVRLSMGAVMDCGTAAALKTWMETSAKPALANKGGGLVSVRVAAHYACRTRNNQPGAKLSEHGKGRAIDISAFKLRDGTVFDLLKGWNSRTYGGALRQMHKGACGPFGTVLGPEADRFHRDHFHFDTARYRSGSFCR